MLHSSAPDDMHEYAEEIPGIIALRLFDEGECGAALECVRAATGWNEAKVLLRGEDGSYASVLRPERAASTLAPALDSLLARSFDARMDAVVKPVVRRVWGVELPRHSSTHVVRYGPGHHYHDHSDVIDGEEPYRYFSVVCYLNEDFEGGRTAFPALGYAVAPGRGKAVIFPSTYLHRAEPVTSGEKYVLVSWLTGRLPVRWI